MYSSSVTMSYKGGYIFTAIIEGHQVTKCTVDRYAYIVYTKNVQSAKILITKHVNKIKGSN